MITNLSWESTRIDVEELVRIPWKTDWKTGGRNRPQVDDRVDRNLTPRWTGKIGLATATEIDATEIPRKRPTRSPAPPHHTNYNESESSRNAKNVNGCPCLAAETPGPENHQHRQTIRLEMKTRY